MKPPKTTTKFCLLCAEKFTTDNAKYNICFECRDNPEDYGEAIEEEDKEE
jgi:hypothetical protein